MDLKTGDLRRVPFEDAIAMPGCFLKDRTKVIASGFNVAQATLALYEVERNPLAPNTCSAILSRVRRRLLFAPHEN